MVVDSIMNYRNTAKRLLVAEGCLLAQPVERLLWRKLPLRNEISASANDPFETLNITQ